MATTSRMSATAVENISTPEMIRRRLRNSIDVYEKIFECGYCDQKFKMKHNLMTHEYIHQLNQHKQRYSEKPFVCSVCGKRFAKKADMDEHEIVHLKRNIQRCSYCKKKFSFENFLQRHERIHEWVDSFNEPFECDDSVLIFQSVEESIDSQSQNMPNSDVDTQPETSSDIMSSIEELEAIIISDGNTDNEPRSNSNEHMKNSKKRPRSPEPYYFKPKRRFSTKHQMTDSSQAHQDHRIRGRTKSKLQCRCCDLKFEETDQKLKHECLFHSPNVGLNRIILDVTESYNAINSIIDITSKISKPKVDKSRKKGAIKRGRPRKQIETRDLRNQDKSKQRKALKGSSRPKRKTRRNLNSSEKDFNLSTEKIVRGRKPLKDNQQ